MAIVKADVVAIAPELSSVDDPTFAVFISDSAIAFDLNAYPLTSRDYIQKNLVAFMMVDQGFGTGRSTRGEVTSERVGEVARTYASNTRAAQGNSSSPLQRNRYGQAVLSYRRRFGVQTLWVGP